MAGRAVLIILILAAAGGYARALDAWRASSPGVPTLDHIPPTLGVWTSESHELSETVEAVYGADTYAMRRYERVDGAVVWLFIAYFRDQQVGAQIHSPRNCVPGGGWNVQDIESLERDVGGRTRPMQRMHLEKTGRRQELVYWFRTRGGTINGEYALKWDLVLNSMRGRPTDAAFIRYHASAEDRDAMFELMGELDGSVEAVLGEVGL